MDSYNAIPLHLAASHPYSSISVLEHLLNLHPNGARAVDNQSQTPLHRACKTRASLDRVMILLEAAPCVLSWRDWSGSTPKNLDILPEVVGLLELVEEILSLTFESNNTFNSNTNKENRTIGSSAEQRKQRAKEIIMRFCLMNWGGGIGMAFAYNIHLFSLMDIPITLIPRFLSLMDEKVCTINQYRVRPTNRLSTTYMLLRRNPLICKTSFP